MKIVKEKAERRHIAGSRAGLKTKTGVCKMKLKVNLTKTIWMALLGMSISISATAQNLIGVANESANHVGTAGDRLIATDSFDLKGGRAVVLVLTAEGAAAASAAFDGVPMRLGAEAVDDGAGAQKARIFYLLNPVSTAGVFQISMDSGAVYAYSMLSLSNALGVATNVTAGSTSTANTTPLEISYSVATTNNFVVTGAVNNDYNSSKVLSVASGNADTVLQSHILSGSSGHFHSYGAVYDPGSYTDGYFGQYQRTAIASLIFNTAAPAEVDSDGDGLSDAAETNGTENGVYGNEPTDPNEADSDEDGLSDGFEILLIGTNPNVADTDLDGLSDGEEFNGTHNAYDLSGGGITTNILSGPPGAPTDPLDDDSDNDEIMDGEEVVLGTDGYVTDPNYADTDGDGYPDLAELAEGTDPTDPADTPDPSLVTVAANLSVTRAGAVADGSGMLLTSDEFNLGGGNAVVLMLTAEGLLDDANYTGMSATYAGQPMARLTASQTAQSATVFYLINPAASTGAVVVKTDPGVDGDVSYSMVSLNNVVSVGGYAAATSSSSANTTPLDVNYTNQENDGFVVAAAVNNDYNNSKKLSAAYGNADEVLLAHTLLGSSGHFHAMGAVPAAGAYTDGFYGQYSRTAILEVLFSANAIALSLEIERDVVSLIPSGILLNSVLGTFSGSQAGGAVPTVFTLVSGTNDTDNAKFAIASGTNVVVNYDFTGTNSVNGQEVSCRIQGVGGGATNVVTFTFRLFKDDNLDGVRDSWLLVSSNGLESFSGADWTINNLLAQVVGTPSYASDGSELKITAPAHAGGGAVRTALLYQPDTLGAREVVCLDVNTTTYTTGAVEERIGLVISLESDPVDAVVGGTATYTNTFYVSVRPDAAGQTLASQYWDGAGVEGYFEQGSIQLSDIQSLYIERSGSTTFRAGWIDQDGLQHESNTFEAPGFDGQKAYYGIWSDARTASMDFGVDNLRIYRTAPAPAMTVSVPSGGPLMLSWPASSGGNFKVLETDDLIYGAWSNAGGTPVVDGDAYVVSIPLGSEPQRFYKLDR